MQQQFLDQSKALVWGRYDPVFFSKYWLGIDLNSFQTRAFNEGYNIPQGMYIAGNRIGKTAWLAIKHTWALFYKLGLGTSEKTFIPSLYRTFNISPNSRQSKESFRYITRILNGDFTWQIDGKYYSNMPNPEDGTGLKITDFITGQNENLGEVKLANNSIHYSLSTGQTQGASYQGLPAGYISYDECVETLHLESDINSMVSRLGDYGFCFDLITSPNASRKNCSQQHLLHLFNLAKKGEGAYKLIVGGYDENIFIPEEQKVKHRKRIKEMTPLLYDQIIGGKFVSIGGKMFDGHAIDNVWNGMEEGKVAMQGHQYIISADWGFADKGDETVFIVIDYTATPWEIVYASSKQGGDPYPLMATLRTLKESYNDAKVIMDVNALGGVVMKKLLRDIKPMGFDSHSGQKPEALSYLQLVLTNYRKHAVIEQKGIPKEKGEDLLKSYYLSILEEQLASYQEDDKAIKQDWVCALYMPIWWLWKQRQRALRRGEKPFELDLLKNG